MRENEIGVLVSDAHRGVFFGYASGNLNVKSIRIEKARMVVYWSQDVHGYSGLAANGPTDGCRIGPPIPAITIQDVVSVSELSDTAVLAFERAPWKI